ncbi:MAG: DUF5596 domain-containing protein [Oscillospiraceae bacterium]|nr:DUF5596 domain-containing protein [Oscillospiraceae bacterium]
MNLHTLCSCIGINGELFRTLEELSKRFRYEDIEAYYRSILNYEEALERTPEVLFLPGNPISSQLALAWMLQVSVMTWDFYAEKGIQEKIYFDTMKCYSRHLKEGRELTGGNDFGQYQWANRPAGGHLFRIGTLEYERREGDITIHIPTDADLSPGSVDKSLKKARKFFAKFFPECCDWPYTCDSWLLDPQLKPMLPLDSNIARFQERFTWLQSAPAGDHLVYLFKTLPEDFITRPGDFFEKVSSLPEETSLQKKVKQHLLKGGRICRTLGRLNSETLQNTNRTILIKRRISMKKKLLITLIFAAVLATGGFLMLLYQTHAAANAAAAEKIDYYPAHVRWDKDRRVIVVEGAFCNENPNRHVTRVNFMMLQVIDQEGNELGTYIMSPEAEDAFRLPPMINFSYDLIVYPYPTLKMPEMLQDGVHLTCFADMDTAPCPGDNCTWCYPPKKN